MNTFKNFYILLIVILFSSCNNYGYYAILIANNSNDTATISLVKEKKDLTHIHDVYYDLCYPIYNLTQIKDLKNIKYAEISDGNLINRELLYDSIINEYSFILRPNEFVVLADYLLSKGKIGNLMYESIEIKSNTKKIVLESFQKSINPADYFSVNTDNKNIIFSLIIE